jgi:nitrogenase molybdenum-iron protein NifN
VQRQLAALRQQPALLHSLELAALERAGLAPAVEGRSLGESGLITGFVERLLEAGRPEIVALLAGCDTGGNATAELTLGAQRLKQQGLPTEVVSIPVRGSSFADGQRAVVRALVDAFAVGGAIEEHVNLAVSACSKEDLAHLREVLDAFGIRSVLLPQAAGRPSSWQSEATALDALRRTGRAQATIELGLTQSALPTAGELLAHRFGVTCHSRALPIGLEETDAFFALLERLSGRRTPLRYRQEREQLVASYLELHDVFFDCRVVLHGEEDLVVSLARFLQEIGAVPVLIGTAGQHARLVERLGVNVAWDSLRADEPDTAELERLGRPLTPDLVIGTRQDGELARRLGVPLVLCGFSGDERLGSHRSLHVGYRGAQQLLDRLAAALNDAYPRSS